jgi:uncharacterized delta-60 repeat protein
LALLAASAGSLPAAGLDGEIDYAFGILGRTEVPPIFLEDSAFGTLAVQPDGRILVFGTTESGQTVYGWRLEPDGRIDLSFVFEDYWPGALLTPVGAVVLPDGRIFLAASYNDGATRRVIAWMMLEDGLWDLGFGEGGWEIYDLPADDESLRVVALGPGGTLLLGSNGFNPSPFVQRGQVWVTRLLANGDPDPSWSFSGHRAYDWRATPDAGDDNKLGAFALEPDGKLLLAGSLENSTLGTDHIVVGRLDALGAFDAGFGTSGRTFLNWSTLLLGDLDDLRAFGVARLAGGGYLVAANFFLDDFDLSWFGTARLSEFGGLDSTYGFEGYRAGYFDDFEFGSTGINMAVDAGGSAVISGFAYDAVEDELGYGVARILPDGQHDTAFDGNGSKVYHLNDGPFYDGAFAMSLHDGGGILLGGETQVADGLGGLIRAMAVLRVDAGLPFTDSFETGDFDFWDGP